MTTARRSPRHVIRDPQQGDVLTVPAGTRLEVRFRRTLGRWQVEHRPGHLVPLTEADHGFEFLVFGVFGPQDSTPPPLRLVRERAGRSGTGAVRDLTVLVRG